MKLEIIPKHDQIRDCFEDLIVSVFDWLNKDCKYLFAYSWDFYYRRIEEAAKNNDTVGKILISGELSLLKEARILKEVHGVELLFSRPGSHIDILNAIEKNCLKGMPTIIYIDTYYCPWDDGMYKEYHHPHFCMAVGIDRQKEEISCVDAFPINYDCILPFSDLEKGFDVCVELKILDQNHDFTIREILRKSIDNFEIKINGRTKIEMIRDFAFDVQNNMDIKKECQGFEDSVWQAPVFEAITNIVNGRRQFGLLIKNSAGEIHQLEQVAKQLEAAANKWSTIKGMLIKAYYKKDNDTLSAIAEKIRQIADDEALILSELKLISENDNLDNININLENTDDFAGLKIISKAEISDCFNNKGIGICDMNCNADLTDTGDGNQAFYIVDDKMSENKVDPNFNFPDINGKFDNISCDGQIIEFNNIKNCNCIMFLGCAEWGNYSEKCTVLYSDGETEEVPIEFSDWYFNPVFGEKVVWTGYAAEKKMDRIRQTAANVYMCSEYQKLKRGGSIKSIKLPKCDNIHIFSLTLGNIEK
ncbi:MAG TPA: hypothetical protein VHO66_02135 [Ruminiclostridium sp.]|nr:hypothetical protein [Ruminiclostridium sp.]